VSDATDTETDAAEAVLLYLVRQIVDNPDQVAIDVEQGRNTRYNVRVADGDMGRVIGRRGRTAQAIRTVVRAAAARDEREVDVDFVD
jgi:predicted RNA-binding protein YlqC (UPF0109 family)